MANYIIPIRDELVDYSTADGLKLSPKMISEIADRDVFIELVNDWDHEECAPVYNLSGDPEDLVNVLVQVFDFPADYFEVQGDDLLF